MKSTELIQLLDEETEKIWLIPPPEVQRFGAGIFESSRGTKDYLYPAMILTCGDMHALCVSITPDIILKSLRDDTFTVEQCKSLFRWVNMIDIDLFALYGFVNLAKLCHLVMDSFDEVETKDELESVLRAWYGYANRMGVWVYHFFPWSQGAALRARTPEELSQLGELGKRSGDVDEYFDEWADKLLDWKTIK